MTGDFPLEEPEHAPTDPAAEADDVADSDADVDAELAEILGALDEAAQLDEAATAARERDEYLDALRRVQAEFDNYRKRVARQQAESIERAAESLVARLLPVLDALDLALDHVPSGDASPEATALTQIAALLRDTLSKEGLERIDAAEVAFDPTIHDAVAHDAADDAPGATVQEVLRAGYQLKGRVVRPAMVQVRG